MKQITLSGCVTGDIASFGLAVANVQADKLLPLFDVVAPLDAPEWINTGRAAHVEVGEDGFQTQYQSLREFALWK